MEDHHEIVTFAQIGRRFLDSIIVIFAQIVALVSICFIIISTVVLTLNTLPYFQVIMIMIRDYDYAYNYD